jgi:fimbrial isopeptide formation D2 family protein
MASEQIKLRMTRAATLLTVLLGILVTLLVSTGAAHAAPISSAPGFRPAESSSIPTGYGWVAHVTKLTKATPFGDVTWAKAGPVPGATFGNGYNDHNYAFNVYDPKAIANKGNFGVFYDTIGDYYGRKIDMSMTVEDWIVPDASKGDDHAGTDQLWQLVGIDKASLGTLVPALRVRYDFFDHVTHEPLKVFGNFTFYDIDDMQAVYYPPQTAQIIHNVYARSNTIVNYQAIGDGQLYYEDQHIGTDGDDPKSTISLTYGQSSSFDLTWCGSNALGKLDRITALTGTYNSEARKNLVQPTMTYDPVTEYYIALDARGILPQEPAVPTKMVTDSDENRVKDNLLKDRYEDYTYENDHDVQDVRPEFYFKSYTFSDQIDPVLDVKDVKVVNDQLKDVTYMFTANTDKDNKVTFRATDAALSHSDFYGHTYTYKIHVGIKPGASLAAYQDPDHPDQAKIDNVSQVTIDDQTRESNVVHTHVKFRDPLAAKYVSADGTGTNTTMNVDYTKPYTYRLDFQVPDTQKTLAKIVLTDNVEPVQTVQSVKVIDDLTGKDITDQGKLSDGQPTTWTADQPDTYHGKVLHMYVAVKLNNTADLLKYLNKDTGNVEVPNHGSLDYGEKPVDTPTTHVIPPKVEGSVDKKIELNTTDGQAKIEDVIAALAKLQSDAAAATNDSKAASSSATTK